MLDNDNLTYSYQKRTVDNRFGKQSERALITQERSQKLDLLMHLLNNLQQSLVVCGPQGIGKTTLLETLRDNSKDLWRISLVKASANSSFESIVNELLSSLNISNIATGFDLSLLRELCAKQKVVLLIDDAGSLVPGLITMLMDFADSLSGLRLVFAMSHDQFHIKSGTDKRVEDCHFIELPPLNKKQCGEYLQNLSAQPGAIISFNAIGDNLIEELYRDTHGVPGKILAELPRFSNYQHRKNSRIGLWILVIVVLAGAGVVVNSLLPIDYSAPQPAAIKPAEEVANQPGLANLVVPTVAPLPLATNEKPVEQDVAVQPKAVATIVQIQATPLPTPQATVTPEPSVMPTSLPIVSLPTPVVAPTNLPVAVQATPVVTPTPAIVEPTPAKTEAPAVKATPTPEPKPVAAKTEGQKTNKVMAEGGDQDWIMAQPPGNFTLQIMVLSNKVSANRFLKKYADYSDGLTYYTINNNGQEKYVLIYGSFKTEAEAAQLKAVMPGEFKQALAKRFRAIQKESLR